MRGRRDVGEVELAHLRTASRIALSWPPKRSTSSSVSARRASFATCRTSSRVIAIDPSFQNESGPPLGARSEARFRKGVYAGRDVRGLDALVALHDLELHALTLGQRLVAVHRDRGEVDEDVLATLTLDEAVALLVREPLDGALSQLPPCDASDGPGTEPPTLIKRANDSLTSPGTASVRGGTARPEPCSAAASRSSSARRLRGPASGSPATLGRGRVDVADEARPRCGSCRRRSRPRPPSPCPALDDPRHADRGDDDVGVA